MKRLLLIPVCFFALAVPVVVLANGARGGFDGVVASIEERYHVHAERIPFLGFISFISRKATQGGVSGVHVAEIDNFQADVDGDELNKIVEEKLGGGWERVIRETSRKGSDQTLIFMHPEGQRMGLFVVDLAGREMDVVQVSVDPDHLNESIGKYDHHREGNRDENGVRDNNESN
jgi:hypothetical protein